MSRVLSIKSRGGFDHFIKISATLKRRRIEVEKIFMEHLPQENFLVEVTLGDSAKNVNQIMGFMNKLEDVYEIKEKMEE
jgi:acetolactate synthase small subunit